ncbi:glycosyltransferase [Thermodesulfobacteriota bacterium]
MEQRSAGLQICMVTHSVYARDARIRRLTEYLAADGHVVDVVCLTSEYGDDSAEHPGINIYPVPMSRFRREGLGVVLEWSLSMFMMFLRTTRLHLKHRYDLIHVHNMPDSLVFSALVPRLGGCPVILNIHDVAPQVAQAKLEVPASHPIVRGLALLEKVSTRFSSHVITESSAAAATLDSRGTPRDKITIVMNAADAKIFPEDGGGEHRRADSGDFTVLFVGTVARRYGLQICVRALPHEIRGSGNKAESDSEGSSRRDRPR